MTNDKDQTPMTINSIFFDVESQSQKDVFTKLADVAKELGYVTRPKKLIKAFFNREKESSTGFGNGFAIPHALLKDIRRPSILFLRLKNGVEWKAIDDQPVKVIIALLIPEDEASIIHMELLSKIAQKVLKPEVQEKLIHSNEESEILEELMN